MSGNPFSVKTMNAFWHFCNKALFSEKIPRLGNAIKDKKPNDELQGRKTVAICQKELCGPRGHLSQGYVGYFSYRQTHSPPPHISFTSYSKATFSMRSQIAILPIFKIPSACFVFFSLGCIAIQHPLYLNNLFIIWLVLGCKCRDKT